MHSGDLGGQYYLQKMGSVLLGYESPAIRFKALARSSPAGFTLLSGLLNKSHLFLTSRLLRVFKTCEVCCLILVCKRRLF